MSKVQEKIVYIRRRPSKKLEKNQPLKVMNDNAYQYLGSCGLGNTEMPVTGLTEIEKIFIMPSIVQVSASHVEFDTKVNDFFHNLREDVPAGKGLRLNVTTETVEKEYMGKKVAVDMPANPYHYILYKRSIDPNYKFCVESLDAARNGGPKVKFYHYDVEAAKKIEIQIADERDKALAAYISITEKKELWEPILLVYGINPDNLNKNEQKAKLREFAEANNIKDDKDKLDAFKKFINVLKDGEIGTKALINRLATAKVVLIVNGSYIYDNGAASVTMGTNEREAVLWMKDAKNSKHVLEMEAKLNKAV